MSEPAASYQPELTRPLDRLRYSLGDIDIATPLLPDATYIAMLQAQANDERKATLELVSGLITRFAQLPNRTTVDGGKVSTEWKDRLVAWNALATRLRAELALEATAATSSDFSTLSPQRRDYRERAEYRRELGEYEW